MNNKLKKRKKAAASIILTVIFGIACLTVGILINQAGKVGMMSLVLQQGVNVFFGIIGGILTAILIYLAKPVYQSIFIGGSDDGSLSGIWDEDYKAIDFPEPSQLQDLVFSIEHSRDSIKGTLIGTRAKDAPDSEPHYSPRLFSIKGVIEANLVSLEAIRESGHEKGHSVYLVQPNNARTVMRGRSLYWDTTKEQLASSEVVLTKRKPGSK
ncbi:hypothetical protein GS399_04990 [Pedobacter sp. HMF7647]|uniref:Uncharacterized protein n=1 Tax=Hufsiella arboris TaxID=2695275 RepID=A0A7K1Y8A6_9SPHI|nr:hypothetical protein [Hufsiella arboris]MXV50319.1 hypothetical protein [Hufsiella arboris]